MPPRTLADGDASAPPRAAAGLSDTAQSGARFEVWDNAHCRRFATLAGAERYARGRVAATEREAGIWHLPHFPAANATQIATVRLDALGRVWTDVLDGTVA